MKEDIRDIPGGKPFDDNYKSLIGSLHAYTNPSLNERGVKGISKEGAGDQLRIEAEERTPQTQRSYLKQAAKRGGLTQPLPQLAGRIDRQSLKNWILSGTAQNSDLFRLKTLLRITAPIDSHDALVNAILDTSNPKGDLDIIGTGAESLAFRNYSDGSVWKFRRADTGGIHSFGMDATIREDGPKAGQIHLIHSSDFGAIQNLRDFNEAFNAPVELLGFSDGMESMLVKQDFVEPHRDTKPSDIAKFMMGNGWELKLAPGSPGNRELIGGHPTVMDHFWLDRTNKRIALDAHLKNFHVDKDGKVFAIDVPTRKLTDEEYSKVDAYYHSGGH